MLSLKDNFDDRTAKLAIILAVVMLAAFKFWKWILRSQGIHPDHDYVLYESLNSIARYLLAVLSVVLCSKYYKDQSVLWRNPRPKHVLRLSCYILVISCIDGYRRGIIGPNRLLFEFFVNLPVGFFEEFAYRGIILVGLLRFLHPLSAVALSSLVFSLFHFDVYHHFGDYFATFVFGMCLGYFMLLRVSLVSLSIAHYLYDVYHFGLTFGRPFYSKDSYVYAVVSIIFLYYLDRIHAKQETFTN